VAEIWHIFQGCGSTSWIIMLVAIIAIPFSMLTLVVTIGRLPVARILAGLALVSSLLPLGIGALGRASGRSRVDKALEGITLDPTFHERIRAEGYKEADGCVLVGIGYGTLPLVVSIVALVLVFVRQPRKA